MTRKRLWTALLALMLAAWTTGAWAVTINAETFPDDNFRASLILQFSWAEGQTLTDDQVNAVTTIDVAGQGITDLTGVGTFTALTELTCSNNSLTSLDLSALTKLERIDLSSNNLMEVTLPDAITNASGGDGIVTLNLSQNALTSVKLPTTITKSHSSWLALTIDLSGNKLTTVTMPATIQSESSSDPLECDVILNLSDNMLTSLDVPAETTQLTASNNALTATLDLSQCSRLYSVVCTGNEGLTAVKLPKVMSSQRVTVDLASNGLTSVTMPDVIVSSYSSSSIYWGNEPIFVNLSGNKLAELTLPHLSADNDVKLNLSGNALTSLTWKGKVTAKEAVLTLDNNQLTALSSVPAAVTELTASGNKLTTADMSAMTSLQKLNLSNNALTSVKLPVTITNSSWQAVRLDLSNNKLTELTLPATITAAQYGSANLELNLNGNELTSLPAIPVTTATLSISDNRLTGLTLTGCTELSTLYCANNALATLDVTPCTGLWTLDASGNENLTAIAGLTATENLRSLNISGTKVPLSDAPKKLNFLTAHKMNLELQSLDMSGYTNLNELRMNNNGLTGIILPPSQGSSGSYSSQGFYLANNKLSSIALPAGTCWLDLAGNQLAKLDLSGCDDLKYGGMVAVSGQKLPGKWPLTQDGSQFKLNMAPILMSQDLDHVQDVVGYSAGGTAVSTSYSNGIATFAAEPATVGYNYNTGATGFVLTKLTEKSSSSFSVSEVWTYKEGVSAPILMDVTLTVSLSGSGSSDTGDQKIKELVNELNPEARSAMNSKLNSSNTETREAANEVGVLLYDTLSKEDISDLSAKDITFAVENKEKENKAKEEEKVSQEVADTKVPAGTDLLKDYSSNTALKEANSNLSVQPKIVEPKVAVESKDEIGETLGVTIETDITIDSPDKELTKQAEAVEELFNKVSSDLASADNSAGGKGVVIAMVFPRMTANATGFFPLKVNLRHLTPGRRLKFWPSVSYFRQKASARVALAGVSLAAGAEGDFYFLDDVDNKVEKVTGDASNMTVVPFLTAGSYPDAFITVDASEKDQEQLQKLAENAGSGGTDTPTSDKDGGGCDAGFAGLALIALAGLVARKRK